MIHIIRENDQYFRGSGSKCASGTFRVLFIICCAAILILLLAGCMNRAAVETRMKARDAGRNLRAAAIEWERAAAFTFDDPASMEQFRVADGEWEIRNGTLRATGGNGNRAILLYHGCFDPVRIEFEATNRSSGGLIGDITVLLNSLPDKTYFTAGYALTSGSYWNSCTTFYREGIPLANTALSPVVSGRTNRVAVTFDRGHIRYEMNGELLLETWDERPLAMQADRWIGVRTWATLMTVDNVIIFRGKRAENR